MEHSPNIPAHVLNPDPAFYLSENAIVLDVETTNINKGDPTDERNHLVLGRWKWLGDSNIHYFDETTGRGDLFEALGACDYIIAHNAKFEMQWLARLFGRTILRNLSGYCTQVAEYTIRSNRTYRLDLDSCAARYHLGAKDNVVKMQIKGGMCPSEISHSRLSRYCAIDVLLCEKLFYIVRKRLWKKGLQKVAFTRMIQLPVLADIEFNGMKLDEERVRKAYLEAVEKRDKLQAELDEYTGGINLDSPKQLREYLYDTLGIPEVLDHNGKPIRTKTDQKSTAAEVLEQLQGKTKGQKLFIEKYREYKKYYGQVSKYLEKFVRCCEEANGILRASINNSVTKTGRYSSTGRNYSTQLQNLDNALKPLFTCRRPDWCVTESDEAQLEFRVAVWFGDDSQGRRDVDEAADVHTFTANIIYGEYTGDGKHPRRRDAKTHTFKPLYGGVSGTADEKRYYEAFREKYKDITEWQDNMVQEALFSKQVTMPTGLIFYYPHLKVTKSGYIEGNTNVRNYPVQYLATAEIVPIALVYAWYATYDMESFIVNTVHDSIIGETHPDERQEWEDIMNYALGNFPVLYMSNLYGIDFDVPLEAEISHNKHWGEDK